MAVNKYKKLFTNTLILSVGSIASKVLVFFLVPLYTYCLSPSDFGIADLLTNTANFLIPFACLGITNAVFRFTAGHGKDASEVLSSSMLLLGIVSAVFLVFSQVLNLVPFFDGYAWLITVYVLSANFHAICSQYLRARGKMTFFAIQGLINTALVIALNLLFLLLFRIGVTGYVLSVVIADLLSGLLVFFADHQYRYIRLEKINGDLIKEMLKYSIPLIPATIFWWITNVSDRYLVTEICGEAANGIYSISYKIPTILTLLSGAFIDAWQLSSVTDTKDSKESSAFFSNVYRYFLAIVFLAAAVLIPLSKPIASILFSSAYYQAWQYMPFLICASLFMSLVSFLGSVYILEKKTMMSFWTSFAGAVLNVVLNIILIPHFDAMGAAFATFVSYSCSYILRCITTHKYISFRQYPLRVILGTAVLLAETAVVLRSPSHEWFWSLLAMVPMVVLFAKSFLEGTVALLKRVFEKKKRKNS